MYKSVSSISERNLKGFMNEDPGQLHTVGTGLNSVY